MSVRIINWNVEWKTRRSRAGIELRARIDRLAPDVVCLTEGYLDFLPSDGFLICADVHDALMSVMNPTLRVATAGVIPGADKMTIDHLAHTSGLRAVQVHSISNIGADGRPLSDHFGMVVDIAID